MYNIAFTPEQNPSSYPQERFNVAAKNPVRPRKNTAEGGCGGNSAVFLQKIEASPAALLVKAMHHRKILFSLREEKIGRAQNEKSKEYFSVVWRVSASGGGAASFVGGFPKMRSDFVQGVEPNLTSVIKCPADKRCVMRKPQTTKKQRDALQRLRAVFAEQGYYIFPVSKWYRESHFEFIAVPKGCPQFFLLARPLKNGHIAIRPFVGGSSAAHLLDLLRGKVGVRLEWQDKPLKPRRRVRAWDDFLSPQSKNEYARLIG